MAASRLSDSQKQELVERYRQGETAQALAQAYGCSPNTVSRVVKAVLDPAELAALKKQSRGRASAASPDTGPSTDTGTSPDTAGAAEDPPIPLPSLEVPPPVAVDRDHDDPLRDDPPRDEARTDSPAGDDADDRGVLAIDDADDFADDDAVDDAVDDAEEGDDLEGEEGPDADLAAVSVAAPQGTGTVSPRPLSSGALPASVYLLVDKTVELDARPLREFPELGSLPDDEQERQALMLYANPRQAKRQCGRSQRVIKVPDSAVLERTSRYLVAQGITRLVLEGGALFAIPGG